MVDGRDGGIMRQNLANYAHYFFHFIAYFWEYQIKIQGGQKVKPQTHDHNSVKS